MPNRKIKLLKNTVLFNLRKPIRQQLLRQILLKSQQPLHKTNIPHLTWLIHPIIIRTKPPTVIKLQSLFSRLIKPKKQQNRYNRCPRSTLSMVTMHRHHSILYFYITIIFTR